MNTMEEWKDIEGYEGLYQVSNYGRVRNSKRGIYRAFSDNGYGYYMVILCKNGKKKPFYVHRLVAEAFIPNPNNYEQINHKNENKHQNNVENLEWCSPKYNMNYGTARERTSEKQRKIVYQYTLDGKLVKIWNGVNQCKYFGFEPSSISQCCNGIRKKHKGHIWSYKPL